MDIDSSCHCIEDRTCCNCGKQGHTSPACLEPRKEQIGAEQTQGTVEDMISKSAAAALDICEAVQKKKKETLKGKDGQIFQAVSSGRHALLDKPVLSS